MGYITFKTWSNKLLEIFLNFYFISIKFSSVILIKLIENNVKPNDLKLNQSIACKSSIIILLVNRNNKFLQLNWNLFSEICFRVIIFYINKHF